MAKRVRVASKAGFFEAARDHLGRRGADVRAVAGSGATVASLATRMQRRLLGID